MSIKIPDEVWSRWTKPEYEPLRIAVLSFGGNTRKEAIIGSFPEIAVLNTESDPSNVLKGTFYLTTKRIVYLPKNMIPHPKLIQSTYEALRCLTANRSSLTMSVIDSNGSTANFLFSSAKALYECFHVLRTIAEASREDDASYTSTVVALATRTDRGYRPFSSIEVELQECAPKMEVEKTELQQPIEEDPITRILAPVKSFFDYCNNIHFDIHLKLRILCILSFIATCLKFVPFVPFVSLSIIILLLFTAWKSINKDTEELHSQDAEIPQAARGFVKTEHFWADWIFWRNPRKTMVLIQTACVNYFGWLILPDKLYRISFIIVFIWKIVWPIFKPKTMKKIFSGYWFST